MVIGCGHLAMLYLERLRRHNPRQPVLVVEKRPDKPNAEVAAVRYRAEVLYGDASNEAVLNSLRLQHADRVVLLTGNDFVNLDTAARICQKVPRLASSVLLHVGDTRLRKAVDKQDVLGGCTTFNSHERAASHLVQEKLLPHFHSTEARDIVVLAGFGRFGQTVLDHLQRLAEGRFGTVVLVDLDAEGRALEFQEQYGFRPGYTLERVDGDLRNPRTWRTIEPFFHETNRELVLVLGTDDAGSNILTALWLSQRFRQAYIVARCFYHSSFTEQLSRQGNFEIYSFADLLLASMESRWFAPPESPTQHSELEPESCP